MRPYALAFAAVLLLFAIGCASRVQEAAPHAAVSSNAANGNVSAPAGQPNEVVPMEISSTAFHDGKAIPSKYTCKGESISPPLLIGDIPEKAKSVALVMSDPDAPAGTWDHWVAFNIAPEGNSVDIPEGDGMISTGGKNSWGKTGYDGPCPPSGTHRYYFRAYALDQNLELSDGATKQLVLDAMKGHIVAQAELMGTFSK